MIEKIHAPLAVVILEKRVGRAVVPLALVVIAITDPKAPFLCYSVGLIAGFKFNRVRAYYFEVCATDSNPAFTGIFGYLDRAIFGVLWSINRHPPLR
jgi:hypothetical protein